jgi:DNA-binding transcriptional ArsR family regulator/fido (protein-threonine AMPylation protein)
MPTLQEPILAALAELGGPDGRPVSPGELTRRLQVPESTLRRHLRALVQAHGIERSGGGRSTKYRPTNPWRQPWASAPAPSTQSLVPWSPAAQEVRRRLRAPLGARAPVGYARTLVDSYVPNTSFLLGARLAQELYALGKTKDQQPAGTYARNVLEQLLIDLSWSSSHLEGNRMTRLDTEELFRSGATAGDRDAVMLLNHKQAIEFMVENVPLQGLRMNIVSNLHAVLMQDLLEDDAALGAIRQKVVRISDTVYTPAHMPQLLREVLERVLAKAAQVNNPLEAAFFLWVNLAYLQPFEDGNKRVSRLAANIPLMLFNCAPLSFLDVDLNDYADAMLGVYEFHDMSAAADLFAWTYRRSCAKYEVVLQAMGVPDPVRVQFRPQLTEAICQVVQDRKTVTEVLADMGLPRAQEELFEPLLRRELTLLQEHNCGRFRLGPRALQSWIEAGRPR